MELQNTTEKSKKLALKALQRRRKKNSKIKIVNNSSLYDGSPMFFYCLSCDEEIIVPEKHITQPMLCKECQKLRELGWLE